MKQHELILSLLTQLNFFYRQLAINSIVENSLSSFGIKVRALAVGGSITRFKFCFMVYTHNSEVCICEFDTLQQVFEYASIHNLTLPYDKRKFLSFYCF